MSATYARSGLHRSNRSKKEGKVSSLRRYLLVGWAVASGLMLSIFLVYGVYSILRTTEELDRSNRILASHYAQQLNKDIDSMKGYVDRIYSENVQFQALKRPYLSEPEWYSSAYYLTNSLEGRAGTIDYFGGVFFYDAQKETMRSQYSEFSHRGDRYHLNLCLKSYLNGIRDEVCHEGYFQYEEETYLVYVKGIKQKLVGFVLNLNSYFSSEEGLVLAFYDDGTMLEMVGGSLTEQEAAEMVGSGMGRKEAWGMGYIAAAEPICFLRLQLAVFQEFGGILQLMGSWEFWMLCILIPSILIIILFVVWQIINRALVWPVEHLASRLDKMKEGRRAQEKPEAEGTRVLELLEINRRLDEIVEEMEHMQQDKYLKEMEANAAKLQYYQLQVNPHFFINCLNLLDSLLAEKNVDTVRLMIRWLSEHFRYVFRNQENLVTIREELREVEAYCHIYMIRGEMPILVRKNVTDELMDCCVPILAIQAFVENSIKHARRQGRILSVEVAVREIEREGGSWISIRVADNGEGYPAEKLEEFNAPVTEFCYNSRHVGIDNIKYRVYLMYGRRAQIFFYNAPAGGAVAELLLPKKESSGA